MVMTERRERIVDFVNSEADVTSSKLQDAFFDVSEMTLRPDLKTLDQQRQIIRVQGGATPVGFAIGTDGLLAGRNSHGSGEKEEVARKATAPVAPSHTAPIDSISLASAFAGAPELMRGSASGRGFSRCCGLSAWQGPLFGSDGRRRSRLRSRSVPAGAAPSWIRARRDAPPCLGSVTLRT